MDKEELITFWKLSASKSVSRNFLKASSKLRDGAFFHSCLISLEKLTRTVDLGQILLGGGIQSVTALVYLRDIFNSFSALSSD